MDLTLYLQVTWKLQPSDTDIDIDIVRELVVEKAELEDIKSTGTATTTSMTAKVPSKVRHTVSSLQLKEELDWHAKKMFLKEKKNFVNE